VCIVDEQPARDGILQWHDVHSAFVSPRDFVDTPHVGLACVEVGLLDVVVVHLAAHASHR
jgi:hypothetical protein